MENFAYLIVSLSVLCVSFLLFREASGSMSLRKINMLSYLFYIPLTLMSFIGAIFIVLKIDNHYLINKIQLDRTRLYGWMAISYTMIMLPLGMVLSKQIFKIKHTRTALEWFANKPISNLLDKHENIVKLLLMALSTISLGAVVYTFLKIGFIPIVELLTDSGLNLSKIRIDVSKRFTGNIYFRNLFAIQLMPILSYISFAYYDKSKTLTNGIWFAVTFIASFFILTYNLEKSPFALYITGFIFYIVWTKGQIKLGKLISFGLLPFLIILFFYASLNHGALTDILLHYNEGISGRVLFSQISGTFFSIELFGNTNDFIGLKSMSNFVDYFGIEYSERAGRLVMESVNPKGVKEGTAGVLNSLFIGEAYANFGIIGILLSPLYAGFIIGTLFYTFLKLPKTPIFIGLYVFFSYKTLLIGGFNDYLYNIAYLFLFIVFTTVVYYSFYLSSNLTLKE